MKGACPIPAKKPEGVSREQLVEFLKANLRLESTTKSEYTGGMDGPLYVERHSVQLVLEGEVISEVSL